MYIIKYLISVFIFFFSYSCSSLKQFPAPGPEEIQLSVLYRGHEIDNKNRLHLKLKFLPSFKFDRTINFEKSWENVMDLSIYAWERDIYTDNWISPFYFKDSFNVEKFWYNSTDDTTIIVQLPFTFTKYSPIDIFNEELSVTNSKHIELFWIDKFKWLPNSNFYSTYDFRYSSKYDYTSSIIIDQTLWVISEMFKAYFSKGFIRINVVEAESYLPIGNSELIFKSKALDINDIYISLKNNKLAKDFLSDLNLVNNHKNWINDNNGWKLNTPFKSNTDFEGEYFIKIPNLPSKTTNVPVLIRAPGCKFFEGEIQVDSNTNEYTVKLPRLGSKLDIELLKDIESTIIKE